MLDFGNRLENKRKVFCGRPTRSGPSRTEPLASAERVWPETLVVETRGRMGAREGNNDCANVSPLLQQQHREALAHSLHHHPGEARERSKPFTFP